MNIFSALLLLLSGPAQAAPKSEPTSVMETKPLTQPVATDVAPTAAPATEQPALPGFEIMLFDVSTETTGDIKLSPGSNITKQSGYDSQPRFSTDGQVLYYTHAVAEATGFQMDIYQYNLANKTNKPYMTTPESEYSPTPIIDESGLAVVQVDEHNDQYIVLLDQAAAADKQVQRYSDLKQVGYFGWTHGYKVWSFVLNENGGGDLVHMGKGKKPFTLTENVGRTLVTDKANKVVYYVDKNTTPWRIKSKQRKLHEPIDIMALPAGVEDFTLDNKGRFWAGKDNTLMVSTDQKTWQPVQSFAFDGLNGISRLTTNPAADKIAIVFAEKTASE